jgi:hypothetical protein
MNYQMLRSNALGASPEESLTAAQTFDRAVAMVRTYDASFSPRFDQRLLDA